MIIDAGDRQYELVEGWGDLPTGWIWGQVGAVGVDSKDQVHVFTRTDHPYMMFDKSGKLAMANAGPNTNGSQFFITVGNTDWLTGKHTIFGEVVEGYDVVEKISKAPRNRQDRPNKDVVVKSVKIER